MRQRSSRRASFQLFQHNLLKMILVYGKRERKRNSMDHYLLIFMMKHTFLKEMKRRMEKERPIWSTFLFLNAFFNVFLILSQEELKNRWLSLANDPSEIHNYFFTSLSLSSHILLSYVFRLWRKSEKRVMMLNNNNNDDDVAKEIATLCVTIIAFSYEISFFFSSLIQIFFYLFISHVFLVFWK